MTIELDSVQSIVFTSGTTGKPKGAQITFGNLYHSALASAERLGASPDDRWLCPLPFYHVGGLSIIFRSAIYGSSIVLPESTSTEGIIKGLHDTQATIVSLVPTQLYRMLEAGFEPPESLRLILLGGAAASPELVARCLERNLPIALTYGLTECASQVATATPDQVRAKPGTVGKPLDGTTVRIVDEQGRDLPAGEYGEIVVSGATVMQGYLSQPPTNGTFHTGDIGYLDADGDLWIVQRRSDLIVSGGENVYPSEVEAVLRQHPAVEDACVVGLPDAEWGQRVAAMVALRQGELLSEADLIAFSRERLAGYKQPRWIVFVDELPQTASGKVQRGQVKAILLAAWVSGCIFHPLRLNGEFYCGSSPALTISTPLEMHGAGDPLVLLHGFTGSGANWSAQIEAFASHFQVVTIDLLGHGETESPADPARYQMELAGRDLIAIFDSLELERVHLLGYSMGGRLALYTALTYPERIDRLILESASPGLKTAAERTARIAQDAALADRIERDGIVSFAEYWSNLSLFASQSPELRERLRLQRLRNHPTGLANSLRGMGTGVQPSLWDRLGEWDRPCLLLCGEHDAKFCAINAEMHDLMPQSALEIIPGAGHTVHAEQPAAYNRAVIKFLGQSQK